MNIFKEMVLSIYSYKSYKGFLYNKKSKVFGFALVLMLIYWLITMGVSAVEIGLVGPGFAREMDEAVPEFELADGILWVDDVIEYEDATSIVNIDTDPDYVFYDAYEMMDDLNEYQSVLLMDSEKVIIKSGTQVQQYYFSELEDLEFTKDDLMGLIPYMYLFFAIFFLLSYVCMTALFFLGVAVVALCGMIVASCMKCRLTFGQLYLLGIYSRVLPLLIKAAVSFLPFHIPFFWVLNFGISLMIIGAAMQKMKEQNLQRPLEFSSGNAGWNGGNGGGNFSGNFNTGGYGYGQYQGSGDVMPSSGTGIGTGIGNGMGNGIGNGIGNGMGNENGAGAPGQNDGRNNGNDFSWMK